MFRELYGDSALENVVLVTNMWGAVPHDVGEARESELSSSYFKPVLDGGAQIVRHHNNTESAHDVVRRITAADCPVVLRIQRELVDEHMDIVDTSAGEAVNRQLSEQLSQHGAEFKKVWDDMMQAFMDKDEVARKDLEDEAKGLQELMERIKEDLEGMTENYAMEKERVEVTVEKMEQEPEREGQRTEAELKERDEAVRQTLEVLWGQMEWIKKDSEELKTRMKDQGAKGSGIAEAALTELDHRLQEATDMFANGRAILEQLMKERERADDEHKRLVELTRHLQDEISASAAHRAALEQEMKELQGRVAAAVTVPPRVPPRPIPCVQILLYSVALDG